MPPMQGRPRGRRSRGLLATVLALALPAFARGPAAGVGEVGRPASRTYGPAELGAEPQNWAVARDGRGRIYAGNSLGVLEHDGVRWRLLRTPLGSTPRALATDAKGVVYVGGRGEFGWLEAGPGATRYRSLEGHLDPGDRSFTEVWSVAAAPDGVYFCARERLFRWDGVRMAVWRPKGTFFAAYGVGDHVLAVDSGQGLVRPGPGGLAPEPGGEAFRQEKPRFMIPDGDGALLWGSRTRGLMRLAGGRSTAVPGPASAFLREQLLYAGTALRDGTLALGTIQGGVAIADRQGRLLRVLDRDAGLADPTVYALLEDPETGLWLGQSRGVTHLEWPARFSTFDGAEGLDGVVVALHRHEGRLYASTQRGLFELQPASGPGTPRFKAVPGIRGQCWSLRSLGPRLVVANFDGLYEVRRGRAVRLPLAVGHALALEPCPWDPARWLVGTDRGLLLVDPAAPRGAPVGPLGGHEEVVQTLVPDDEGGVWVGCDGPLAFRVAATGAGLGFQPLGPAEGLPADPWRFTVRLPGGPRILTASGLFRRGTGGRLEPDPDLSELETEGASFARVAAEGRDGLWVGFQRPGNLLRHARRGADGRYRWDGPPAFSFKGSLVFALLPEAEGVTWFGGVEGLCRLAGPLPGGPPGDLALRLLGPEGEPLGQPSPELAYGGPTLRFEYAVPRGLEAFPPRYQVRLEGHSTQWSAWSGETYRDFAGLREGRYQFRVRAQAGPGGAVREAVLPFRILPPWFRRPWAYVIYGFLGLGLLGLLHRLRMRVLERRAEDLARQVTEATRELTAMNHALADLNEQKGRFLALATHDLRTPLHGIALAAERMQGLADVGALHPLARRIEQESLAMGDRLSQFLLGAGPAAGRSDLGAVLTSAMERHGELARRKGIPLTCEAAEGPLLVPVEGHLLDSIVDNLLSNALKFSPPGASVRLGAALARGRAQVWVVDQGPGLTELDRQRLFTGQGPLAAKPTAGEGSLGLGLALTYDLVRSLGGRLWAEEGPGGGTAFRVEFPLTPGGILPR